MRATSRAPTGAPLLVVLMLVGLFCAGFGLGQLFGPPSLPGLSTFGDSRRGTTEDGSTESGSLRD